MKKPKLPCPYIDGEYIRIYNPAEDVYRGVETKNFKTGEKYSEWITNDFSVIKDGDIFHMVGITHPKVPNFIDAFNYGDDVHEAEFQLFHAYAKGENFKDVFFEESFTELGKILYPQSRPGEGNEIWAPALIKKDGKFHVIYSPKKIRMASSSDFENWEIKELFECQSPVARDPFVYFEDGEYYIIYTESKLLKYRKTRDFETFSDEEILQETLFADTESESPFLMKKDGIYYLFWSIWNGKNGCYDDRTMVFASETLEGLRNTAPITMLRAHAPEIVRDNDGTYYLLSVFSPRNGVCAVKLGWE